MNTAIFSENFNHRRKYLRLRQEFIGGAIVIIDIFCVLLSSQIAYLTYRLAWHDTSREPAQYFGIGLIFCVLFVSGAHIRGAYSPNSFTHLGKRLRNLLLVFCGVVGLLSLTAFTLKIGSTFSRGGTITFAITSYVLLFANHMWWFRKVRQMKVAGQSIFVPRRILLISINGLNSRTEADMMRHMKSGGLDIVGKIVLPKRDARDQNMQEFVQRVSAIAKAQGAEEIVIYSSWRHIPNMLAIVQAFRILPLPVRMIADSFTQELLKRPVQRVGNIFAIDVQPAPMTRVEFAIKRIVDILISSVALFVLSPLLIAVAIAIRIDSRGPVLFKQKRLGFNGAPFKILKFRSMHMLEDGDTVIQAKRGDSRVTRVGKIIRRTSIDELPQLWNILCGDMSLVGPRPHAMAHDSHYERNLSEYAFRQHVKPGLTGWAQVNGSRGETPTLDSMAQRVSLDMWYINNRSLLLDIKILLMTAAQVFNNPNAY